MAAELQILTQLTLSGSLVAPGALETIGSMNPIVDSAVSGNSLRQTLILPAGSSMTLDAGELTPRWWFFANVHASVPLKISYGLTEVIELDPGQVSFLRSAVVPSAAAAGGVSDDSQLLYGVFE